MIILLAQLIIGVVFLIYSTHTLVHLSSRLSGFLRISPLVSGSILVAFTTSLPELVVSLVAIVRNDHGLAMGNIIGSNVVNTMLILPLGIFIGKIRVGTTKTQKSLLFFVGSALAFIFFPQKGLLLLGLALIYTLAQYFWAKSGSTMEDAKYFKNHHFNKFPRNGIPQLLLSVVGVVVGGILVVGATESISTLIGLSTTVLGLTLTATITSLPELMATIFSQEEGEDKVTLGNIIGSNVYNLLLIGGILAIFGAKPSGFVGLLWLAACTFGVSWIIRHYRGKIIPRFIGFILVLCFAIYSYTLYTF